MRVFYAKNKEERAGEEEKNVNDKTKAFLSRAQRAITHKSHLSVNEIDHTTTTYTIAIK